MKKINQLKILAISGLAAVLPIAAAVGFLGIRYSLFENDFSYASANLSEYKAQESLGKKISFRQVEENLFNISVELAIDGSPASFSLEGIDLSLFIPAPPVSARSNQKLAQWFAAEREFNRERVIFDASSPHLRLPELAGYEPEDISVALTNNCLGAGYWEVAVYAEKNGVKNTLYEGYFTFPRGLYREVFETASGSSYWQHVRNLEAWPGFQFFQGNSLDLAHLRTVRQETEVDYRHFQQEKILVESEQENKQKLIVNKGAELPLETWQDIVAADIEFQTFIPPGIYQQSKIVAPDYAEIAELKSAAVREIASPLAEKPLQELELQFRSEAGETRKFIASGLDLSQIPQLPESEYDRGLYIPIGVGTPFTQTYEDLKQNRPDRSPIFSLLVDGENRLMDYRYGVGLNGIVMHRDAADANLLHFYFLSYERISLVSHYAIRLPVQQEIQIAQIDAKIDSQM